ncbi:general odorant-binding protein 28a [Drosophila gunungcola]|uniref:general odorant-binding protein 28a n=1 Tax=Drosophila gunungcola TaxID=103775 RepID=UPI0022E23629|nr:general odorant-binding protein 28a [Drosophila gunungcola]
MQRSPILFIVAAAILLAIGLVHGFDEKEVMAKFMESAEACMPEVGATDADMQEVAKRMPASTYAGKCLRACVMKKCGVMDANGKMDKAAGQEKAKQYTGNDPAKLKMAMEIADTCSAISVPDDHCEAAESYGACFKSEATKHGLV